MYSLLLTCEQHEKDRLSAELWEAGATGIQEFESVDSNLPQLQAFFESDASGSSLLERFARFSPRGDTLAPTDWVAATLDAWPARPVGQRLFLAPPWSAEAAPAGRVRLVHNPGMACGTGEHPCTQLALEALEEYVEAGVGVADVGTGSGMLAIAALLLGARHVTGVDPDEAALSVAQANFQYNSLRGDLAAGSADCLAPESFGLVVANLSATVLLAIADDLLRILTPSGTLILTGFEQTEAARMAQVFPAFATRERSGWSCLISRLW